MSDITIKDNSPAFLWELSARIDRTLATAGRVKSKMGIRVSSSIMLE